MESTLKRSQWMFMLIGVFTACDGRNPTQKAAEVQTSTSSAGEPAWITANRLRLKGQIYKSAQLTARPILIVVLHGDLLEKNGVPYHYLFAGRAAAHLDNVIAAALLRPGYADDTGDQSAGSRGLATGDNYTPEVVDAIAGAIDALKTRFQPAITILVGHSGGAAIAADVLGRCRSADAALLVSCPCNVPVWRKGMARTRFSAIGPFSLLFLLPVNSLSPLDLAGGIPASTRVRMVVGSQDPITALTLTQEYAERLRKVGIRVDVTIAPGLGHNILLEPVVFEQLKELSTH